MNIILFAILCIIDIILLSAHWYLFFFLLSFYLFLSVCVGIYYFTRPTKKDKQRALKELLEYYIKKDEIKASQNRNQAQ